MPNGLTRYRIIYELYNRVREHRIDAATPFEAFRKWKDTVPEIVFKNASVCNISEYKNAARKYCYPCKKISIRKSKKHS